MMTFSSYLSSVLRSWRFCLGSAVIVALLAVAGSLLMPLQYSSTVRLLVTQANAAGLDPYTALKSTEQIATSLRELVYTSFFLHNVLSQTKDFQVGYFSPDEYHQRKEWQKAVDVSITPGTGIMTVAVYHPDRNQAKALVEGVSKELITQVPNYFGYNAKAQIIDTPLESRWFAKPDFLLNAVLGAVVGFAWALLWMLVKWVKGHERT